jgi:uncharacterized protein (UPF0276 family)
LEVGVLPTSAPRGKPAVGIGYRAAIDEWTRRELHRFDVLEITVDHCLNGSKSTQSAIFDLVGAIPLTAHGIGLSIGTDVPIDLCYLDRVAELVDGLKAPAYSEHLAFTRVPGRDLANLLPVLQTEAVAERACLRSGACSCKSGETANRRCCAGRRALPSGCSPLALHPRCSLGF